MRYFRRRPRVLSSLSAYAQWADHYPPAAHNPLMQAEQTTLLDLLPDVGGQTVLDLACGSGRYSQLLNGYGAHAIIAVDNSAAMLRVGKRHAVPALFLQGETAAIPLGDQSVDGVICALALGHLPDLAPSMREIARVLKSGGWALISDFHPDRFRAGAMRTFKAADGKTYAVEHYLHSKETYAQVANRAGLTLTTTREPQLIIEGRLLPVVMVYAFKR